MQQSARLMSFFVPGHEMQEAQNKLEAFRLFAFADRELNIQANRIEPLAMLVQRALALGNYRRIWALEGISYYYTNAVTSKRPERVLADPGLPACAMVPIHAGMGTAFAGQALGKTGANPSRAALTIEVERFFDHCRANARPGWYENAIEPLGLAARTLKTHLVSPISDVIGEIDINARRLFWHGVGRSLYFVPSNFLTVGGAHGRALRAAINEAPTPEDRNNAVAGLIWAVTLVNIRHAFVLKNLLRAADRVRMPSAVKNGIVSSLMVWKHMVPEDAEFLPAYSKPEPGSGGEARLWNESVASASSQAFATVFPSLLAQGRIASVFQYREI